MSRTDRLCVAIGALLPCAVVYALARAAAGPSPAGDALVAETLGFTEPGRMVTVASLVMGRLAELPAAEGQVVAEGAELARLESAPEQARAALARLRAESTVNIEIAQSRVEHARVELERLRALESTSAVSKKERRDAEFALREAELELALARLERDEQGYEHDAQQALLERMTLRAPFAGYVAERSRQVGDTVEEREAVLTFVQLDPLIVTVDCPLEMTARVAPGQHYRVRPVDTRYKPRTAQVVFASEVADAASQTRRIKLTAPNADREWIAGMKVLVDFSTPTQPPEHAATALRRSTPGGRVSPL